MKYNKKDISHHRATNIFILPHICAGRKASRRTQQRSLRMDRYVYPRDLLIKKGLLSRFRMQIDPSMPLYQTMNDETMIENLSATLRQRPDPISRTCSGYFLDKVFQLLRLIPADFIQSELYCFVWTWMTIFHLFRLAPEMPVILTDLPGWYPAAFWLY